MTTTIRYRGYVYDSETNLYYLQSRYYNPEIGRFVSADGYVLTKNNSIYANLYAYCGNNAVCSYDSDGCSSGLALGILLLSVTVLMTSSESQIPEEKRLAKEKYNSDTVNVYWQGGEPADSKINVRFYVADSKKGYININVSPSLSVQSRYEMDAILDVIIESPYYSSERFGTKGFMRAQWIAHNMCYDLAVSGEFGFKVARKISGAENPIKSSAELDIRNLGNMSTRSYYLYKLIETIG